MSEVADPRQQKELESVEIRVDIENALSSLTFHEYHAVLLFVLQYTEENIARMLGITQQAVHVNLVHAFVKLGKCLE